MSLILFSLDPVLTKEMLFPNEEALWIGWMMAGIRDAMDIMKRTREARRQFVGIDWLLSIMKFMACEGYPPQRI
ncbi:hypothetical protein [Paenibacillus tundrae]|uniref:hypothetical protein n=1 Tax=Paenibacillus tundrae TaxID=528187 RepID=UPI0030D46194